MAKKKEVKAPTLTQPKEIYRPGRLTIKANHWHWSKRDIKNSLQ